VKFFEQTLINKSNNNQNEIWNLVRYFIFWVLLSLIDRVIFISYFSEKLRSASFADILRIFRHGLKLDLSMAAYICIIPFLVYMLANFIPKLRIKRKWLDIYTGLILIMFGLFSSINLNIYREWGDKISMRVFTAFWDTPKEAMASSSSSPVFMSVSLILCISVGGFALYKLISRGFQFKTSTNYFYNIVKVLGFSIILFTCIRGGYGRATLNSSMAYFSENSFYNHAAVNTHWALMKDVIAGNRSRNPYKFFTEQEAQEILKPVFENNPDSSVQILTTQRPNVVLVILEGFVGGLIHRLGGEEGITPNFEKLIDQGYLFDQIYSAADRSDKGIIGIYSAFPAQGPESIIKHIIKHEELPGMGQEMSAAGYENAFYYGGQSEFYNFKSYMLTHGNQRVIDQNSFSQSDIKSSWGVYDNLTFKRLAEDATAGKKPFFKTLFTITNHEPFELETTYKYGKATNANKFRSTAFYTDSVIYDFIEQAKQEDWYKNTLFVFVADHGHRLPEEKWELDHPNRFHIPLLFFGEVIKPEYRGKINSRIGNQTDFVSTLFHQLGISAARYSWSRDLLNPTVPEYAFFNSKDVFGVVSPEQDISFNAVGRVVSHKRKTNFPAEKNTELLNKAKAYYQEVYRQFLNY